MKQYQYVNIISDPIKLEHFCRVGLQPGLDQKTSSDVHVSNTSLPNWELLADRSNGRAHATVLRPSGCRLWRMYCG